MYSLLEGVRVLELSLLAPDLLGMHLADLGAEVIKIEQPPRGDYLREIGSRKLHGLNLMHLRWNRGKKSVALDLKRQEGQALLHRLTERSQVLINGLRAGAAERCGAGYPTISKLNPAIVYCSLSGTGQSGPYSRLATHGVAYDAFAGLAAPTMHADGTPRIPGSYVPVGMFSAPLYAAVAVCAALTQAARTGKGAYVEIAEMDAAVSWQAERIDASLNSTVAETADMTDAVRYQYYWTSDDQIVLFQASERKFWRNFCDAIGRMDLFGEKPGAAAGDHARGDEELRKQLVAIFRAHTREEWVRFFIEHDLPGGPVYDPQEIPHDQHFRARDLLFDQNHPIAGQVRLFGTPVKIPSEPFSPSPAPGLGENTDEVLTSLLGLSESEIEALHAGGVVKADED